VTVTATTKPVLSITNATYAAGTSIWTVLHTTGVQTVAAGYPRAVGTVEATVIATYKGWIRSHGYVAGMMGTTATATIGLPVVQAADHTGALTVYAGAGFQIGQMALTASGTPYNVYLWCPFRGRS
jgi:hypothetical protein